MSADTIELSEGTVQVDATLIATGLAVDLPVLQQRMRQGLITSLCERGVDEDQGRFRLTFFSRNRRFRIIVDAGGHVLNRFTLNLGR